MKFNSEYAGFVKTKVTDNEARNPGLGHTIEYDGGKAGQATVYVYTRGHTGLPDGVISSVVRDEFENAINEVFVVQNALGMEVGLADKYAAGTPGGPQKFLCAEFIVRDSAGAQRSFLYMTAASGRFVKLRVTLGGNDPTNSRARHFADAVAADLPKTEFYRVGTAENATLRSDGRVEVLGLVRLALPGPWPWYIEDMNDPGAKGAICQCWDEASAYAAGYVLVADVSADPDEPDVGNLEQNEVAELDRFLEREVRKLMECDGREMVRWMSSQLNESGATKGLATAYIGRDQGRERQYVDLRMTVSGRLLVLGTSFDIGRAEDLSAPLIRALQEAETVG